MLLLLSGIVLFFGIHSVSIFALPLRDRLAAKSPLGWKALYGIASLIGLILMTKGYADLRLTPTLLYAPPVWLRHIAALLLLPVFILFIAPYFPGRISTAAKHPQLVAVKIWALAHLLVNGMLADVLLFGSFLIWAVIDRISVKRRPTRPVPGMPHSGTNDIIIVVVGLALYVVTAMWLHEAVIGIKPFA